MQGAPSLNTCRTCKAHEEDTAAMIDKRIITLHSILTLVHKAACTHGQATTPADDSHLFHSWSRVEGVGSGTDFYKSETANRKLTATAKLRIAPG